MAETYLSLNLEEFEKQKKQAIEDAQSNGSEDTALWESLNFKIEPQNTDIDENGNISISGELGNLGYMSIIFSLDLEDISDLIEFYIKKLNRLKTVLEATK